MSHQYIGKLIKQGVLPTHDGKIDPAEADAILAARRQPAQPQQRRGRAEPAPAAGAAPQPTARPAASDAAAGNTVDLPTLLLRTRIKSEAERARLLEIKAKVEAGKFVDVDEVRIEAFNTGRQVRDALLNIPSRLSAVLAAETDERACFALLDREIREALIELTGGPQDE